MEVNNIIKDCRNCIFLCSYQQPECNHPYWDNKLAYSNIIDLYDKVIPDICPLRKEDLILTFKLE